MPAKKAKKVLPSKPSASPAPKSKKRAAASPSSAKAKAAADPARCESTRKLGEALGGGEVWFYNLKKHPLPDVVNTPPEKELAVCDCWLVHFPSRRCVAVPAGRGEALRLLKKLEAGKDELGWLPAKSRQKPRARARAGVCVKPEGGAPADPVSEKEEEPARPKVSFTEVPPGLDFDRAMKHVFPNERITQEIEKLLAAADDIYDKDGGYVGSKAAWMVRKEAVKLMIDHAQGRPGEKPPPPPDKKKISYEELETMIMGSPASRAVLKRLIEKSEKAEVCRAAVPAAPAVKAEGGQ
jgi:hypothetical protein